MTQICISIHIPGGNGGILEVVTADTAYPATLAPLLLNAMTLM